MKKILSVLLVLSMLFAAAIPAFAAQTDDGVIVKNKLAVKVTTESKTYGTDEEIVFNVTVTNIGIRKAERVYVQTSSHKHVDLDDDQGFIIIGDLEVGESKTVELYGRYSDIDNSTLLSRLLLKSLMPMYEFIFTIYANVIAPMFNNNMSYCAVNFVNEEDGIDKDYGVLVFAKSGNLPGEIETTTEAPATEEPTTEGNGFEEIDPEVTDDFVELPSGFDA